MIAQHVRPASFASVLFLVLAACHSSGSSAEAKPAPSKSAPTLTAATRPSIGTDPGHAGYGTPLTPTGHNRLAAFAAGCFWGVEDAFRHVPGVVATAVGYAGGHTSDPTYESVSGHTTGHAETVLVEFDPTRIPYEQLLRVFWMIHDPTQVDGQGPDLGDNYRSIVFTFDEDEAAAARASLTGEQKHRSDRIVTRIQPVGPFYLAEGYHQQYTERTGSHACPIAARLQTL
jgi:methionine-S-sulfoxide reductase